MITKIHNKETFDKCDPICRKYVKQHFLTKGIILMDNPDIYGVDLLTSSGQGIELETKWNYWTGIYFPFSTIHYLERKGHLVEKGCHFVQTNSDFTRILLIPNAVLRIYCLPNLLVENPNIAVSHGEKIWNIPTNEALFDDLINDYKTKMDKLQANALIKAWEDIKAGIPANY